VNFTSLVGLYSKPVARRVGWGMLADAPKSNKVPGNGDTMTPRISAVVPTRDRPDHAVPCAGSILSNVSDDFELLIVDQSEDDATEQALAVYAGDRSVRPFVPPWSPQRGGRAELGADHRIHR
jgi:hypothetical protein